MKGNEFLYLSHQSLFKFFKVEGTLHERIEFKFFFSMKANAFKKKQVPKAALQKLIKFFQKKSCTKLLLHLSQKQRVLQLKIEFYLLQIIGPFFGRKKQNRTFVLWRRSKHFKQIKNSIVHFKSCLSFPKKSLPNYFYACWKKR